MANLEGKDRAAWGDGAQLQKCDAFTRKTASDRARSASALLCGSLLRGRHSQWQTSLIRVRFNLMIREDVCSRE
jgi:hypothetical protein